MIFLQLLVEILEPLESSVVFFNVGLIKRLHPRKDVKQRRADVVVCLKTILFARGSVEHANEHLRQFSELIDIEKDLLDICRRPRV